MFGVAEQLVHLVGQQEEVVAARRRTRFEKIAGVALLLAPDRMNDQKR